MIPHPAEEEEVLPVRTLEPDFLEREGRLCRALPTGPLDLDGLENPLGQEPPVALSTDTSSLACVYVWRVVRVACDACGAWCVVRVVCVASDRRKKAHANNTQRTYAKSTRKRHSLSFDVAQVGSMTHPSIHLSTMSKLWLCLLRVLFV